MADKTKINRRNIDRGLTTKELTFVLEYLKDRDATRAARDSGYKHPSANSSKLLQRKDIQLVLGHYNKQIAEEYRVERNEILKQLAYCATRNGVDFVDENGNLIENLNDLPDRAKAAVDSIEQTVKTWVTPMGDEMQEVRTKLRLVPKATAIDMAMKHLGAYKAEIHEHSMSFNFDELYDMTNRGQRVIEDPIEAKVLEMEDRRPTSSNGSNGKHPTDSDNGKAE